MKKILIFISFLLFILNFGFAKDSDLSDKALYNQIVHTFNDGIYDSSISLINQLKKEYPSSNLLEECDFIYAKCLYYQKKYKKALVCFYDICKNQNNAYYYDAILYSARSFFQLQSFNEAIPLYEVVIANGNHFSKNDYVESLKKLLICYNNTGNKNKTVELLNKINKDEFGEETYNQLVQINESVLADYYLAKKLVDENKVSDGLKILNQIKTEIENSENASLKDSYYALLMRCYAILEKWDLIPSCYEKIVQKNNNVIYFTAYAYFTLKNYEKVIELLEDKTYLQNLYKYSVAIDSFKDEDFSKSLKASQSMKEPMANYLSGLNCVNLKNWKKAISYFDSFLKSNPKDKYLALFYKGYSEFSLNQNENSLKSFEKYINDFSKTKYDNKYLKLAYEYGIRNAISLNKKTKVFELADSLLLNAQTEEDKLKTAIFVAEIYSDYLEHQKAIDVLTPFSKSASEKNLSVLYTLANLYEKNEQFDKAHSLYNSIYTKFPKDDFAPLSLFRQAQLYYLVKDYKNAEASFYKFIYDYPKNENLVAALYYCSQCYVQNGKKQNALMMCNTIINDYTSSTYEYATYNTMLSLYYDFENYGEALNVANILIKKYPAQVGDDGILEKQKELSKIVAGTDKEIAKKSAEYSKVGKTSVKGRVLGTELVLLYFNNGQSEEAYDLAKELVALQIDQKESFYKAQNYEIIASYNKNKANYKTAAENYLLATEFYRITDQIKPAETLYLGVECFSLAKMHADAEETAKLLIKLYPETKYAKNVKMLIKK